MYISSKTETNMSATQRVALQQQCVLHMGQYVQKKYNIQEVLNYNKIKYMPGIQIKNPIQIPKSSFLLDELLK